MPELTIWERDPEFKPLLDKTTTTQWPYHTELPIPFQILVHFSLSDMSHNHCLLSDSSLIPE